jgi:hypothetical protein
MAAISIAFFPYDFLITIHTSVNGRQEVKCKDSFDDYGYNINIHKNTHFWKTYFTTSNIVKKRIKIMDTISYEDLFTWYTLDLCFLLTAGPFHTSCNKKQWITLTRLFPKSGRGFSKQNFENYVFKE